jgi:ankyrin repeat protein
MANTDFTSMDTGPGLGRHASVPSGGNIKQSSQHFENIHNSEDARVHMGNAYTTNFYSPAAIFNSVPTKEPRDPVHAEFVTACAEGQRQARLDHLIRRGANIDHRDRMQGTPLHHAAFGGHLHTVSYLLDAGVDIDATGDWIGTPLGLAAVRGHLAVVELLLAHRASPNRNSKYIGTAAHMACAAGRLDILMLLHQNGATKDIQADGCTRMYLSFTRPYHALLSSSRAYNLTLNIKLEVLFCSPGAVAVWMGHIDMVRFFLGGPNGLQLDETANLTTMDHQSLGRLRTQWQRKSISLIMLAVSALQSGILRLLLERGADARSLDTLQRNALFWIGKLSAPEVYDSATNAAHSACVTMLRQHGLNVDDRDHVGWTALISAAHNLKYDAARILLNQGAHIDAADEQGRTALMYAANAQNAERLRTRFVRLLCQRGANVSLKSNSGRIALDYTGDRTDCTETRMLIFQAGIPRYE